jgi:DNA invertase Pin-like site-specific DNA recombinase
MSVNTPAKPPVVTVIQPRIAADRRETPSVCRKKRVAAYARVSTDDREQLTSYEAQVDFYTRHIKANEAWEFVGVYTDEGISATNTKHRDGFNRMIADALDGRIDLILTKSVSRFARNTVDSLTTVRKLKEKGVEVYFEKENICTLDSKGELLITVMSSLAQEESRSISENVRWGIHKNMADGRVSLPYGRFLGYEKGGDGLPKIVESEAETIRLIYRMFLEGKTYHAIARHLTESGIPTPGGRDKWQTNTVKSILTNEKYAGNAILQKKFTVDFLTKKKKINEGEYPQYYVEHSHPAIIPPETFELVQSEIEKRKPLKNRLRSLSPFSHRVFCGECGGVYGPKIWHSKNIRQRKEVWQCNGKYGGKTYCRTPHLTEEALRAAFVKAFNVFVGDKDRYIAEYAEVVRALTDTADLEHTETRLNTELTEAAALIKKCVDGNAREVQDQAAYRKEYDALVARCEAIRKRLASVSAEKTARVAKRENIRRFLYNLKETDDLLTGFDESLWLATAESLTVYSETDLLVTFKDGSQVRV